MTAACLCCAATAPLVANRLAEHAGPAKLAGPAVVLAADGRFAARRPRGPRGFTLVGNLVALCLGLAIVALAASAHLAARRAHRLHDAAARIQETGVLGLEVLGRHFQLAGFADLTRTASSAVSFRARFGAPALLGCSRGYPADVNASATSDCVPDPAGNDGALLRHQALPDAGDPHATLPGYRAETGEGADCLGQSPQTSAPPIAASLFRVHDASLSCTGNGNPGQPQPMLLGVEQLRLLYSVDSDGDGTPDLRLRADDPRLAASGSWDRVTAVEACLLVRSEEPLDARSSAAAVDCDGAALRRNDGRPRRVFRRTFVLPNLMAATAMTREGPLP